MNNTDSLKKVITQINQGKRYPAVTLVDQSPELAAMLSKLVKDRTQGTKFDIANPNSVFNIDQGRLAEISTIVKNRMTDSENMMQLFPDLELAAQILISSILSPKDMVNTEIIYKTKNNVFPSEVLMLMTEVVKKEMTESYNLKALLPEMLRAILFESGSYVQSIIPESSVDELINNGMVISKEDLTDIVDSSSNIRSLGILGNPNKPTDKKQTATLGLESLNFQRIPYQTYPINAISTERYNERVSFEDLGELVGITDNFTVLKLPNIIKANNKAKIRQIIKRQRPSTSLEARDMTSKDLELMLYKGTHGAAVPFVSIKTKDMTRRRSVSRPLVMHLPSESVIPVFVPGDKKSHIGYFVLIDEEGNPISRNSASSEFNDLQSQLSNHNSSMTSYLIKKAHNNLTSDSQKSLTLTQAAGIYADIIESELIQRLKNGIYGSKAEIGKNEEVYRIMLARSYANQYTRLVYIPAELVTYFAFKYHENGIGKSLLDDLKVITGLRSILTFAKVMALTKNSIALTHVNMTLDPHDPDPQKTIEIATHEIIKMRQQYFPLGINTPSDLVDWIQRAGFEFTFEGHPGLPQTKFDFETKQMQHTVPDSDLEEMLRKQTFMALGLSPETVDAGFTTEFATTVVSNNILLSKRVLQTQEQILPQVTDYVQKLCINDVTIANRLLEVLKENIGNIEKFISNEDKEFKETNEELFYEHLMNLFVDNLEIDLPKPDITSLENQSEAFDHYKTTLDSTLDAWINSEFINTSIAGEIGDSIDVIKSTLKAHFLRRWMAENGFMNELNDIVSSNEDGKATIDLYEMMKAHVTGLTRSSVKYIESLKPMAKAADQDLQNLNVNGPGPMEDSSITDETPPEGGNEKPEGGNPDEDALDFDIPV